MGGELHRGGEGREGGWGGGGGRVGSRVGDCKDVGQIEDFEPREAAVPGRQPLVLKLRVRPRARSMVIVMVRDRVSLDYRTIPQKSK